MSSTACISDVVITTEHRRFAEFCDACRRYGYIGLCYGASGVGKTSLGEQLQSMGNHAGNRSLEWSSRGGPIPDTILYTPSVVNTPRGINTDITRFRATLTDLAKRPHRQNTKQ